MKILKHEDEKTRIIQGWYFNALGYTIRRQRKRFWGWKTVAWLYTGQYQTIEDYAQWFNWKERKHGWEEGSYKQF